MNVLRLKKVQVKSRDYLSYKEKLHGIEESNYLNSKP